MMCWHFAGATLRDGRPLPKRGDVLRHEGSVTPCKSGYHASKRALNALSYAPGAMVALVDLRGEVKPHGSPVDKYAASERENLTDYVDATRVLHEFACWCATKALDREEAAGRKVDPRSRAAIATKLAWLDGKATDTELAAASARAADAAWNAASTAAHAASTASWNAASTASWNAASTAAWAAVRRGAWDAAWDASGAASWAGAAAWHEQNAELERRLMALLAHHAAFSTEVMGDVPGWTRRVTAALDVLHDSADALLALRAATCPTCGGDASIGNPRYVYGGPDEPLSIPCPSGCDAGRRRDG